MSHIHFLALAFLQVFLTGLILAYLKWMHQNLRNKINVLNNYVRAIHAVQQGRKGKEN